MILAEDAGAVRARRGLDKLIREERVAAPTATGAEGRGSARLDPSFVIQGRAGEPRRMPSVSHPPQSREVRMLGTILLILLILLLIGALPTWGHSRSWGYAPSGTLGIIVIILLILVLTGRI